MVVIVVVVFVGAVEAVATAVLQIVVGMVMEVMVGAAVGTAVELAVEAVMEVVVEATEWAAGLGRCRGVGWGVYGSGRLAGLAGRESERRIRQPILFRFCLPKLTPCSDIYD